MSQENREALPIGATGAPEHPSRLRAEWLVAVARVVLAGGALIGVVLSPSPTTGQVAYLLVWYLLFSGAILALVWAPTRFAPGWALGLHLYDLAAFTALMVATNGETSPFFLSLTYLLICATIRWELKGVLWTAAAAAAAYTVASWSSGGSLEGPPFLVRIVNLAVVTMLLAYVGAHHRRFQSEIGRFAAWPRTVSRDPREIVAEVASRATDLLEAPRLLLLWDDPEERHINVAFVQDGRLTWEVEDGETFGPIVAPSLEGRSFQALDAEDRHGRVIVLTPRGFLRRQCRPLDERLRARFDIHAVGSWPLRGELVRGRMFCLDKRSMSLADLTMGEFVAHVVTARLDGLYMLRRLREAAALEERVRVARNLHDSLLQSQAGAALQLLAARRLLDRDPEAARQRLADVQQQLERGELEMRAFIRNLRPRERASAGVPPANLLDRLRELQLRVAQQWEVEVRARLDERLETIPASLSDHIYRLAQEAVINAARHAGASVIRLEIAMDDAGVHVAVADDGKGFPFSGTFDLASLVRMRQGPLTLKERVAELRGDLQLTTSLETGTDLRITVPLAAV